METLGAANQQHVESSCVSLAETYQEHTNTHICILMMWY